MTLVSGNLPVTADGSRSAGGYSPGTGVLPIQLGTPSVDTTQGANNQQSAPQVIAGANKAAFVDKAANTPPALADVAMVQAISPNNTGLPVNVPVIVQKANAVSTGSVTTLAAAFANAVKAGNSIVVVCGAGNNGTITVTDSLSNTYTSAVVQANSTTFEAQIFYAVNITGGADTVTMTLTSASAAIQIYEVSGLIAQITAQPDQSTSATGTSATPSATAIAPNSPNSLAFMGIAVGTAAQASSVTAGTGWTLDSTQNTTTPAGLYSFGVFSQFLGSTTPVVPKATIAGSEPYALAAAIFKPVVLGIAGIITQDGYNYTHVTTAQSGVQLKTGPGILHAVIINTHAGGATLELDDALSHTNPMLIITLPGTVTSAIPIALEYDIKFSTGLNITSVTTADYTIVWK